MITRILKLALVAGAGVAAWKAMQQRQSGPFLERALHDGVAATEAARSAQLRGASAELRGFAQQLEHDHGELNAKLAESGGVTVPDADAGMREALRNVDACQGEAFDRAWLRHVARGHARTIRMFQREVEQGGSGAALASDALPTLRAHARRIEALQASVGAATGRASAAGNARTVSGESRTATEAGDAPGAMA